MRFLIVDDDPACRRLVKTILAPYGECDLAFDGGEAIDAVRLSLEGRQPYDLICLDIMIPGTDGYEALEAIRRLEAQQGLTGSDGVKIVMTTALADSKHCIRAFRHGCESYVTKPIQAEKLLEQVRLLLGMAFSGTHARSPETPQGPIAAQRKPPAGPESSRRPRYLIVDDDAVCRELLKAILSGFGQCVLAYDGQEAIDAVRLALEDGKPFDMICLDIMMPGMNGHEALTAIRGIEGQHGIRGSDGAKVVMTTALRDAKHCIRSFREGCESYLTKPIDETELVAKMHDLGVLGAEPVVP